MIDQILEAFAPGKINLVLKVTGRRSDNYHLLDTCFVPLSFAGDRIRIAPAADGVLTVRSNMPGLPEGTDNLAGKAAMAYGAIAGVDPAWTIDIEKNLPLAAGLGGGSADAAAVLKLLNGCYGAVSKEKLAEIALSLGADVPFFLEQKIAWAQGVGEEFSFVKDLLPELPLLVINPRFPVSAKWAYQHLDGDRIGPLPSFHRQLVMESWKSGDFAALGKLLHNDLAFALLEKFPLLRALERELKQCGACGTLISGSGPSFFALFRNFDDLRSGAEKMRALFPDFWFARAKAPEEAEDNL